MWSDGIGQLGSKLKKSEGVWSDFFTVCSDFLIISEYHPTSRVDNKEIISKKYWGILSRNRKNFFPSNAQIFMLWLMAIIRRLVNVPITIRSFSHSTSNASVAAIRTIFLITAPYLKVLNVFIWRRSPPWWLIVNINNFWWIVIAIPMTRYFFGCKYFCSKLLKLWCHCITSVVFFYDEISMTKGNLLKWFQPMDYSWSLPLPVLLSFFIDA